MATPLPAELRGEVLRREPRIRFLVEDELLPPMRFPADFHGDPDYRRSPAQQSRFERLLAGADALYGIPDASPAALKRAVDANPELRWVQTMAAGGGSQIAAAGLSSAQLERVAFTTSAGVHGRPLAEFALFGLLAAAKRLPRLQADQRRHVWPAHRRPMAQLGDWTVLVIGLGGVGSEVARMLAALGANVIGMSRRLRAGLELSEWVPPERLLEVVGRVDAIVSTLPGTERTAGLIGAEVFERIQAGLTFVNVGRGSVVDERALLEALDDGWVGFAALDVFATEPLPAGSPLWEHPNVLVSPHTAALDPGEEFRIAGLFADNATRLLDGRRLRNLVDTLEFY
ncbi:D-2-hydroxyacid dehydrogenase [Agromyces archimandritae]|uniref:D-2-hydroxyacid dehydrogenase n=1 Tax=Agromyces archimandritae TaxID=2781962 RepID=A0A975FQM0_9MICO|nr:D-2-hydroxyacid dehydrogenase [Agromyces archimandritae]